MKKITIKDIAKALGYSIGTVSKALSNSHEISAITKVEIQKFADEHGYQSNQYAKLLRTGRTNIIGMIVPSIGNPFFSQILEGIEREMSDTTYNLIIMQSVDDPRLELKHLEMLYKKGADAVVIAATGDKTTLTYLQRLIDKGIPIVLIDRTNYEINTYKIGIDNFKVVYQGISQLINQGKRKILFISNQSRGTSLERQRGYIQCLRDFDITFNSNDLLSIETNRKRVDVLDQLKNHLTGLVDSRALPEAIFTASDQLTYLTLEALHAIGITVPERIALLGFANFQYTTIFQPSLSSVVQPSREIGSQAFAILNKILDSPDHKITTQYQNIELQASILTRKSSE
ncbi:LacI family transcriptional regulator [Sphingobacterium siyangense]|jgi:LacI family transcriptional regulator|uniref:LacI family DNA-binding transcriptional regulator n=1 Tax=Sphingobacterium TaxID=28453 RepID=UPI0009583F59|nr:MULTISPECIES: LacI family DNA-binding transcriptional regulator [Sphingobacterium]APU96365.1 hypothetical protein BV902_08380 [Sphingobacterium sp. B29]UQA76758.1 LacI family transcriptional regulator [Sphingobacterium siyangense]